MDAKHLNNQEKLDHIFEMVHELNEEMHHLKRREAANNAFRLFYMAIILGALGGAYFFLLPLFETIKKLPGYVETAQSKIDSVKSVIPNPTQVESTVNSLKTKATEGKEAVEKGKSALETVKEIASSTSGLR